MLGLNFVCYYFLKSVRENRKRRLRRRRRAAKDLKLKKVGKDVEKNVDVADSSDEEDDIVATAERPIISKSIMIWALLEVYSLVLSLIFMVNEGFKNNFLADLSFKHDILKRIMYYKLFLALTLLIGAKYVS